MTTLDVLIAARAEVEKGWCKYTLERGTGEVCAIGALRRVKAKGEVLGSGVVQALTEALPRPFRASVEIANFNDLSTTTKADVLALFDRAINAEAAKQVPVSDPAHVHTTVA
jgi:hypothetical protein